MTAIESALGIVDSEDLGVVSTHEHLFINLMRERRGDGLLVDEALMAAELSLFASQGGTTIFDLTTAELTPGSTVDADPAFTATQLGQTRAPRSVEAIQRVSRQTAVNVLLGTGRYRDPFLDRGMIDRASVEELAAEMVRDLTEGIPGTTAKAAIIGEIGADAWYVSATEERVHRAAAAAHRVTGAPVYTHSARWPVGLQQVDLLLACGVEPSKIAVGHSDTVLDDGYPLELAKRGVFVAFDTLSSFGLRTLPAVADRVIRLIGEGHGDRILLGQDVCTNSELVVNGGTGFTGILGVFRGLLTERGVDDEQFHRIVMRNPIALLT